VPAKHVMRAKGLRNTELVRAKVHQFKRHRNPVLMDRRVQMLNDTAKWVIDLSCNSCISVGIRENCCKLCVLL
jgi:hypothetical protein